MEDDSAAPWPTRSIRKPPRSRSPTGSSQIEGVAFLLGRRRAILADEMGLGKTRQAIVSLRHLTPGGARLIVCPASVKRNWAREILVVAPDASILVIEGTAPIAPTAEWVIVNYD